MLLGLIRPTAGRRPGCSAATRSARAAARSQGVAGFVEAPQFYPYLTGRKNLELCAAYDGGDARARGSTRCSTTVDLADRAGDRVGGYSHGMQPAARHRRLAPPQPAPPAARRAADGPRPGRDARHEGPRSAASSAQGITVLLSSHQMADVEELCNRVAIMQPGPDPVRGRRDRPQAVAGHAGTGCAPPTSTPRSARRRSSSWPTSRARTASCASAPMRSCSSGS